MMRFTFFRDIGYAWKGRHIPECALLIADTLWRCVLTLLILSLIGFSAYGLWTYLRVVEVGATTVTLPKSESLNKSTLEDLLERFDARVRTFESLQQNSPAFADPS